MTDESTEALAPKPRLRLRPFRPHWILVELLVVFVGVYGAFLLSELQEDKRSRARAQQIQCALVDEMTSIVEGGQESLPLLRAAFDSWLEQYQQGQRPVPLFLSRGGVHRPSTAIWDSALTSGATELLEVDLLHRLAEFYHALHVLLEKYEDGYVFAQAHILPHEGEDVAVYYRTDDPNLKGHYLEYMNTQAKLVETGEEMIAQGANLLEDLRASCGQEPSSATVD